MLDDAVKVRRGKRLEGVSRHFDHLSGRTVKGQQILTLGLATQETFLPLDSDLYISSKGAHPLKADFHDGRSVEARRYADARDRTKPELAADMLRRAQRQGLDAEVVLADAWFGTKTMIKTALDLNLTAILRMKKNTMKYRLTTWKDGAQHTQLLDAQGLYRHSVRKHWQTLKGMPYQTSCLDVELSLERDGEVEWIPVRLLFVRGLNQDADGPGGANAWALFLSTDRALSPAAILEFYALRWSIEIYQSWCLRTAFSQRCLRTRRPQRRVASVPSDAGHGVVRAGAPTRRRRPRSAIDADPRARLGGLSASLCAAS
ncbi:transposase [Thiorhodococcus minor]|uniref:Transposase n=1 Tax=Thiorhodococcus minor TaxID=57489 RepID=A0A6M0K2E9_9GAMM|nr:transposase [Thiorhodococcus minor]